MSEETEKQKAAAPAEIEGEGVRSRRLGVGISLILVVATLCGILAFVSVWADRQLLSSGYWTDTSAELIEQPEIRHSVSTYLVDLLFANVDVQGELQQNLPPDLQGLAGPATAGLRELADRAADRALDSPRVQQAWVNANKAAHETAITIIEGGNEKAQVQRGVVSIDLRLLLTDLADRVGVGQKLISKLPPNVGEVVVLQSDELETAQNGYDTVKSLATVLTILTFLLFGLAIGLAAGRRRRAVAYTGMSFVGIGLGVLLLAKLGEAPVVDALATTEAVRPAVLAVFDISTGLLREQAASVMFSGVLILIGAWLAGASRPAVSFRSATAPYLRHHLPLAAAVAAAIYLLLVWWTPTMGFRTGVGLTMNTLIVVAGFIALTVITRREYPDSEPVDFQAKWEGFKGAFTGERAAAMRKKAKGALGRGGSTADELEHLAGLRDRGVLSDDEFAAQKQKLLGG